MVEESLLRPRGYHLTCVVVRFDLSHEGISVSIANGWTLSIACPWPAKSSADGREFAFPPSIMQTTGTAILQDPG